ncbi:MAG: methionyl-tRNA formyltransferase [Bryobacterales bacterium]|nr:methionyl-tRNA formyltransferase [Bryobacterales bacterium]
MRAIFIGTPEFAVPSLALLAKHHQVAEVVTQPDRPAGRGRRLAAPPVRQEAEQLSLPAYQPERIRDERVFERLASHAPEVIAVVGYGQMIPKRIRDLPPHGCVNVHSSLLPKYRGAAPVNWALVNGETRTGVTTMRISRQMDAGDILLARSIEILPAERASDLNRRLASLGAKLLIETLQGLQSGTLQPRPQDHEAATFAPLIRREDGLVDWSWPAKSVHDRLRGFDPWPGIYSFFRGKRLRIREAQVAAERESAPGCLAVGEKQVSVGCGQGSLVLEEIQMEGRNAVTAADFARGYRVESGEVLRNG